MPSLATNTRRMLSVLPEPDSRALCSTLCPPSSRDLAWSSRTCSTNLAGVVPSSAVNRRGELSCAEPHPRRQARRAVVEGRLGGDQVDEAAQLDRPRRPDSQRRGELRLSAGPLHVYDEVTRHAAGQIRAVLAFDERESQVDAGGDSGRGEDLTVLDEQRVRLDLDVRISPCQQLRVPPVRSGPPAGQQPRGGQDEGAGADRDQATRACVQPLYSLDQVLRDRIGHKVVPATDHHRVGGGDIRGASVNRHSHPHRRTDRFAGGGDVADAVLGADEVGRGENLGGADDIEHLHAVEDHKHDQALLLTDGHIPTSRVRGGAAPAAARGRACPHLFNSPGLTFSSGGKLRGYDRPVTDESYDAIVIGTSQGGRFLPVDLAKAGRRVALVERAQLGGVCVNRGCTPTKTMVASARLAYQARRGAEYGLRIGPVSLDLAAVRQRKQTMVEAARENYASRLTQDGLDLIEGEARFTGPKTLEVTLGDGGRREIGAPVIVLDTGTRPRPPTIRGVEQVPVLDSTSIMELDELPEHLIVLGGGYIGLEFGQMFRRFGSEVTIVQSGPRLMMTEDEDVSDEVAKILREDGITVLTSATASRVQDAGGGRVRLTVGTPDGEQQIEGSHLLSAIGRLPNVEALAPEAAGIRLRENGFVEVDEHLETSAPGIYAMGDVTGFPAFTHSSYDDSRILRANLLFGEKASTRDRIIPYTVFIDPQLGRVGMTERQARQSHREVRVAKLPMSMVVRALETGETRGFMKAVVDADTREILGAAVLGAEGGEIMTIIQVAMMGELPYTAMANAIFTHPLLAEGLNSLFMEFGA